MVPECGSPLPLWLETGREKTRLLVPQRGPRAESARGLALLPVAAEGPRRIPEPDPERSVNSGGRNGSGSAMQHVPPDELVPRQHAGD